MSINGHSLRNQLSNIAKNQRPHSVKYYLSGKNLHIHIGKFATKGYFQLREFLAKEIALPSFASETDYAGEASDPTGSLLLPNNYKTKHSTLDEIKKLTRRSNEVLCRAKTVWPFALFTDHIVLDRTKLTITKKVFFMSSNVMSIRIEDILNVSSDVGPFLGSISVAIRIMNSEDHVQISNLTRGDSIHLKHIIQGYVIAQHNKIDVEHLSKEELIEALTDLGHDLNV